MIRNAHAKSIDHWPRHSESHAENVHTLLQVQKLDDQESLGHLEANPLETFAGSNEAKPHHSESYAENVDMSLQF